MSTGGSSRVPELRRRVENGRPVRPDGDFVLYWMTAFRRLGDNFALERAVELALELGCPLVVLEALRSDYRWASDRLHHFVLDGMADHGARLAGSRVRYYPYVEPARGAGRGLLEALGARACAVVTDDSPAFFLPHMRAAAARRLGVALESVDSNGLLPLRAADRVFYRAYDFRRFLQQALPTHLEQMPEADPLAGIPLPGPAPLPREILERWPPAAPEALSARTLAELPIDHRVPPVSERGGARRALEILRRFVDERVEHYDERRNHPDDDATSGLSPYLHFGHISAHRVFAELARHDGWDASMLAERRRGQRDWWGLHQGSEAFLDELVTWRELGFNFCQQQRDYESYASLPDWARRTLDKHAGDPRDRLYAPAELEAAATHDPLWNAAQRQLLAEGRIAGYLRMLWGKKILEWSPHPEVALATMIELNNRYAVDGRDPNSTSGICWCLGRYDRAWGPERPVFGTVRYMSSESTRRKLRVKRYLERWSS